MGARVRRCEVRRCEVRRCEGARVPRCDGIALIVACLAPIHLRSQGSSDTPTVVVVDLGHSSPDETGAILLRVV